MNLLTWGMQEATCARHPRRRCSALRVMDGRVIHLSQSEMTASSLAAGILYKDFPRGGASALPTESPTI